MKASSFAHVRTRRGQFLACAALLLAGSCSVPDLVPPPVATAPAPFIQPQPRPAPALTMNPTPGDWRTAPLTPGQWHWAGERGDSVAYFGADRQQPRLDLRCGREGIRLEGVGGQSIVVATSTITRPMQSDGAPLPNGMAGGNGWPRLAFGTKDPLLDAMAFSRGRFALEAEGAVALILPTGPEIARVIEDCRQR